MITLTIVLLLIFVPPVRRLLGRLFMSLLTMLGIIAAIGTGSSSRRRGY